MKKLNFSEKKVDLDDILLDPRNPRFLTKGLDLKVRDSEIPNKEIQSQVRKLVLESFKGYLIKDSIREIGFLKIDRIVCRELKLKDKIYYLVIEGNRRIAAAKDLKDDIIKMRILHIDEHVKKSLIDKIEILVLENVTEGNTWLIQGLRHISGIIEWRAYEKATAIKTLYELNNFSVRSAAEITGSLTSEIGRYLRTYAIYDAGLLDDEYGSIAKPENWDYFDHLGSSKIWRDWLGFSENRILYKSKIRNKENLNRVLSWIYDKKITAGRELRQVRKFLKYGEPALDDFEEHGIYYTIEKYGERKSRDWLEDIRKAIKALDEIQIKEIERIKEKEIELLVKLKEMIVSRLKHARK